MSEQSSILLVEDDQDTRETFKEGLEPYGYSVREADCGRVGISKFRQKQVDVVVSDLKLPDVDGIEVLRAVKLVDPLVLFLMVTGFASVESAVEALEEGALDYFVKPVNFKHMDIVMQRALADRELRKTAFGEVGKSFCGLIGATPKMNWVYTQIRAVAKNDVTVLIAGETGTGKETAARAIHELSNRKSGPFIAVNCGALPEHLLEGELFGHVKGAFTGAVSDKRGLFDAADGGTILLDQIESASAHTQVALLRVIDEKEVRPIGGTSSKSVDVRILAASNQDLDSLVEEGKFREDLFYRLIPAIIVLPPLRERVEDIPALVECFLIEREAQAGRTSRRFSPKALELMTTYSWPGNVRELKHTVQHAVMSSHGTIVRPVDLPISVKKSDAIEVCLCHREAERRHLESVLKLTNWNKSKAASILRVPRSRVYSLMVKHGLSDHR